MAIKDRSTGYIGSKFVGIDVAMGGAPAAPPVGGIEQELLSRVPPTGIVGSQGKKPGEWNGSTYLGPQLAGRAVGIPAPDPVVPPPPPVLPTAISSAPPVPPPLASLTREEYDSMTPEQRRAELARRNAALTAPTAPTAPTTPGAPSSSPTVGLVPVAAPPGFEQVKWADPTKGVSHKYVGARHLAAGGTLDSMLALPMFAGWKKIDDDKIQGPAGSVYDVYKDYSGTGTGQVQWTAVSGPAHDKDGKPGNAVSRGEVPGASGGSGKSPVPYSPYNPAAGGYVPPSMIPMTQMAPPTAPFPTANVIQSLSGPSGFFRSLDESEANPWMAEIMGRAVNRRR